MSDNDTTAVSGPINVPRFTATSFHVAGTAHGVTILALSQVAGTGPNGIEIGALPQFEFFLSGQSAKELQGLLGNILAGIERGDPALGTPSA